LLVEPPASRTLIGRGSFPAASDCGLSCIFLLTTLSPLPTAAPPRLFPPDQPQPDYKDAEKVFPDFRKRFGPRGVIHSFADGRIEVRRVFEGRGALGGGCNVGLPSREIRF